jgi:hypothetical protein
MDVSPTPHFKQLITLLPSYLTAHFTRTFQCISVDRVQQVFNFRFQARSQKFIKEIFSFVMYLSVRLSCPTEQFGSHWTDFHEI